MSAGAPNDLDRDLERLRIAVGRVDTNLLELEQHPIKALLDAAPLRGTTAARWAEASTGLAELFRWSVLLRGAVERATEIRGTRRMLDPARARELAAVLYAPSIELSDSTIPFEARELLGSARIVERCTPDELSKRMGRAFEDVKQLLLAVDGVWGGGVARVAGARAAALELAERAERLGGEPPARLAHVQSAIDSLADEVLADPLAVDPERLDEVDVALDAARPKIEEAEALRDDLDARFDAARRRLAELDVAVEAGRVAGAEAKARIAGAEVVDSLAADHGAGRRLDRVMALAAGGDWAAGAAALARWQHDTDALLERARDIERRNRAQLEVRDELRGRLDAFHAKAAGLGRLEDHELQACFDEARSALYTAPTDLVRAGDLVRRYQTALGAPRPAREAST